MEKRPCCICDCIFTPEEAEQTKCSSCKKLYPKAKTREEAITQSGVEEKKLTLQMTQKTVEGIVYKILAEAGIRQEVCRGCEKKFFAPAPAVKYCKKCRAERKKSKEAKKETENV